MKRGLLFGLMLHMNSGGPGGPYVYRTGFEKVLS